MEIYNKVSINLGGSELSWPVNVTKIAGIWNRVMRLELYFNLWTFLYSWGIPRSPKEITALSFARAFLASQLLLKLPFLTLPLVLNFTLLNCPRRKDFWEKKIIVDQTIIDVYWGMSQYPTVKTRCFLYGTAYLIKTMTQHKSVNYGNTNVKIVLNASKREARQAFQSSWGKNQNMFESTYAESWILCYPS